MTVRLATIEDMEGVKALLRKYHRDTISDEDRPDGFVTTATRSIRGLRTRITTRPVWRRSEPSISVIITTS